MNQLQWMTTESPSVPSVDARQRLQFNIRGVVQGVGFRPFVYGLATRLGLAGFVGNNCAGVVIEVEGSPSAIAAFAQQLSSAPPLAHIESITETTLRVQGTGDFVIAPSSQTNGQHTLISPDLSLCDDCLGELFDSSDRRYRYPFINCTNCGPRFTITRTIPYDRSQTTMAAFPLCPACRAEYEDPANRRFHAQPNACPVCGPQVELRVAGVRRAQPSRCRRSASSAEPLQIADEAIRAAQELLGSGQIVAVKGIGGFHLACDGTNDCAVQTLRQRKGRVDKPFAVMAWDIEAVRRFAEVSAEEEKLLTSRQRPIVLLRKHPDCPLSPWIAPGNNSIGVMLPYSPLHYLLLHRETGRQGADNLQLVMTSGNYSDEPIVTDNDEALTSLAPLADAFLLHNRPIQMRCDDSVVRVVAGHEYPLRRSRGYAPFPVKLPFAVQPILAVGGELKSTFCLTTGDHALMSQHIGDMQNLETVQAFEQAVSHFQSIFQVTPQVIASDLHPGYLSTKWAQQAAQTGNLRHIQVQHHHAHIAAVLAEHGCGGDTPVIGFSFDGTGYGPDGAIWGGEVLLADYRQYQRVAHLKHVPLPGADAAIKHPYRLALAHLWAAGVDWHERLPPVASATSSERRVLARQFSTGFHTIPTSSMGRLFDAVAALIGVRQSVNYEGQAAIELEALAAAGEARPYQFALTGHEPILIDPAPVVRAIAADLLAGVPIAPIAAGFHNAVADLITQLSLRLRQETGLNQVALSGGVFQNTQLLTLAIARLQAQRFAVLWHRFVPPNDDGLALGQAVIANFQ